MKEYKLALIGFGGVNRSLARLIIEEKQKLFINLGFSLKVVGISDSFFGSVIRPEGLTSRDLKALKLSEGGLGVIDGGNNEANNHSVIRDSQADIIVEATVY